MKIKTLFLVFLSSIFLFVSLSSAAITCSPCSVGNCQCSITDCSSGTFGVYRINDCSGFPSSYVKFTGGTVTWSPIQAGTYYIKAFCDGFNSVCTPQTVSSASTTSTATTSASTSTSATTSTTTGDGGTGCSKEGHACTDRTACCSGLTCISNYCRKASTTTTSTTKSIQTTTTAAATTITKRSCIYQCCKNEDSFYDKECPEQQICENNMCVPIEVDHTIYYYIIIGAFIAISIPALMTFLFFRRKQSESKAVYKKISKSKIFDFGL